jgi:hypothetical protein
MLPGYIGQSKFTSAPHFLDTLFFSCEKAVMAVIAIKAIVKITLSIV